MAIIYQASNFGDADLRVALVERDMADLLVYRVAARGLAHGDALWYITPDQRDASVCICFVSPGMAQLKVSLVPNHGDAGWQRPRPPKVHLG